MTQSYETHFFLGANSPTGFYSLYDSFTDPVEDRLLIIKSGPGSGKSTFMRIIADSARKAGMSVEYIHCSGDPDSLDGIRIPEKHIAYVDGTSPHVIEPSFAGSGELYVDLNRFYRADDLRREHSGIMRLTGAYKAQYQRAYKLIGSLKAAADGLTPELPPEVSSTAFRRIRGVISRELRPGGSDGRVCRRFLSALTHAGPVCRFDTVDALADRVYALDNDLGLAPGLIGAVADAAEEKGFDTIRCLSPMAPEQTEHLIIPELRLAFVSQTENNPYPSVPYRHLRLDSIPDRKTASAQKEERKTAAKITGALRDEAVKALSMAKKFHDELEALYNPHVDFDGVRALAKEHADRIINL